MERYAVKHQRWADWQWRAVSALVNSQQRDRGAATCIHEDDDTARYLYPGFRLSLFADELESYYQNLLSDQPSLFVVSQDDENGISTPFQVSLAYDEATRWTEVEAQVFRLPIPPDIYVWTEAFVVRYYAPEIPKKRKRKRWFKGQGDQGAAKP